MENKFEVHTRVGHRGVVLCTSVRLLEICRHGRRGLVVPTILVTAFFDLFGGVIGCCPLLFSTIFPH